MSLNYKASRTGIKGFFLYHGEKILLVAAFAALAAFFAMGYGVDSLEDSKTPTALKDLVEQAKVHVDRDTWVELEKTPERAVKVDHPNRVKVARAAVRESFYVSPILQTPIFKELVRRMDPEIYPPEQIEVAVRVGAVAHKMDRSYIDKLKDAVDPETEAPKKPKKEKPGIDPTTGYPSSYGEMSSMPGYGMETAATANMKNLSAHLKQKFQKEYFTLSQPAALEGAYVVAVKAVVPMKRQRDEYERTFVDATGFDPARDRPEVVWFEAERAEMTPGADPEKLEWKWVCDTGTAQEQAGKEAARPEEVADPRYLLPGVTSFPVPPMVMVKLKDLGLHSLVPAAKTRMAGMPGANPDAKTTADGAPIAEEEPAAEEIQRGPRARKPGPAGGVPGYGGAEYGAVDPYASMYGGGGMPGYGQSGEMPYGSAYGAAGPIADVDYKLVRFFDFKAEPGKTYRYRIRLFYRDSNNLYAQKAGVGAGAGQTTTYSAGPELSGGYSGEMPSSGAYGDSAGGAYAAAAAYGGYGSGGTTTLKEFMLSPEVLTRLAAVKAEDAAAGAPKDTVTTYWRTTEWSEPSGDVVVPHRPEKRFAGEGEGARRVALANGTDFPAPSAESHAKVAVSVWDNNRAVDVPTEIDAYRGTVLNRVGNMDVLHPAMVAGTSLSSYSAGPMMSGPDSAGGGYGSEYGEAYGATSGAAGAGPKSSIRRIKDYALTTDAVVLDVRGGDKLPGGDARNPMKSPSMVLIVNGRGELELASEVEDAEAYRDTLFIDATADKMAAKAKEAAAAAAATMSPEGGTLQP